MLSVDVPILEKTNTVLIEIPYGFEEEIQFNITDKTLSESTAVLYIEQPTGLPVSVLCNVNANVVSYAPSPHDFFPGNNICQIRVGKYLSMNIVARCHRGAYTPSADVVEKGILDQILQKYEENFYEIHKLKSTSDILSDVLNQKVGTIYQYSLAGYEHASLSPLDITYNYGTAVGMRRGENSIKVILYPENNSYKPIINTISTASKEWHGWKYFDGTSAN